MSDPDRRFDRRSSEPPLTIDNRRADRSRGPAPVTLVVSVILLVAVAGGVFYMYRSGVRGENQPPQPLGAPLGDVRAPAPAQAQTPDPGAGLTISKDDQASQPATANLAPPPEQPLPLAPPPAPPPAAAKSPAAAPPAKSDDSSDAIDRLINTSEKPKVAKPKLEKPVVDKAMLEKPKSDSANVAPSTETTFVVQIGAFSTEHLADREWSKAAAVAPGAMAGRGKRVVPVTKDGGTLYRTSITGFATREKAVALCEQLKAAGGNCFVR